MTTTRRPLLDAAHALAVLYDRPVFGHITGTGDPCNGDTIRLLVVGHDRRVWAAASAARWRALGGDFADPYWARVNPSDERFSEFEGQLVHVAPSRGGLDETPGVRWLHPEWHDEWSDRAILGPRTALYEDSGVAATDDPTVDDPATTDIPVLVVHLVA